MISLRSCELFLYVIKASCGKNKEEVLRQLREMAKSEPGFSYEDADQIVRFNVDDRILQPRDVLLDCEHDEKPSIGDSYKVMVLFSLALSGRFFFFRQVIPSSP